MQMSANDNFINARFCWQTRIRSRVISILSATPMDCFKKKVCLSICFLRKKFFSRDFRFSFPRESSFPQRIPGSVYNNNNGCIQSRDMSDGRSRAVHVCSPSHATISKIRCSDYTCSIFEQNIRLKSALNAKNVTVSLPRILFITTTMAAFVVTTCLAVNRGQSAI